MLTSVNALSMLCHVALQIPTKKYTIEISSFLKDKQIGPIFAPSHYLKHETSFTNREGRAANTNHNDDQYIQLTPLAHSACAYHVYRGTARQAYFHFKFHFFTLFPSFFRAVDYG